MDKLSDTATKNIAIHVRKAKTDFPFDPREGCVACAVGKRVYVFGGVLQSQNDQGESLETNDLLLFNIDAERWQKVETTGSLPPPRAAASIVAVGTKLYLFGGLSQMTGWFSDMFVFDTETGKWSEMETTGDQPCGRDKLQGVAVGSTIYYFGGFGPKTQHDEIVMVEDESEEEEWEDEIIPEANEQEAAEFGWFNDLYSFDTEKKCWAKPLLKSFSIPTARAAHGMCAIDNILYVFGGRDISDRQNDLHSFNLDTGEWKMEENAEGAVPPPRSFHTITAVGRHLLVIGGRGRDNSHFSALYAFDSKTSQWLQPDVHGVEIPARGQHIAVMAGGKLVVFGGTGEFSADIMQCQKFYTDTFLVDFDSQSQRNAELTNGTADK